jgi:hypothetical protein
MENKFRGTNERGGGNSSARGASQNTYAKNIYGRRSLSVLTLTTKFGFGPKRTSPSFLISWPDLALAHHLLCLPISVSPSSAPAPAPGKRPAAAAPPRVPPQSQLPAPTNPPNSRALGSPQATPGGNSCQSRKFFSWFRPFAFAPLALFSFLTPPRSAPFIVAPDHVFSSEGAVFRGR